MPYLNFEDLSMTAVVFLNFSSSICIHDNAFCPPKIGKELLISNINNIILCLEHSLFQLNQLLRHSIIDVGLEVIITVKSQSMVMQPLTIRFAL